VIGRNPLLKSARTKGKHPLKYEIITGSKKEAMMARKSKGLLATVLMGLISFLFVIADYLALHDIWHDREPDLSGEWTVVTLSFIPFVLFHVLFAIYVVFPYFNAQKPDTTGKAEKLKEP
jgi:hypothetical protein